VATTPITLTPAGGLPYAIVKGHLLTLARGAWVLDVELDANSLAQNGMPSGKCTVLFGGVPLVGTIDSSSSGSFGPTAMVRIVAGANGWSSNPTPQQWHADNGVLSTPVYQSVATSVGEVLVDLSPTTLGIDFVCSGAEPAMAVFRDSPWFVDTTGTTFVGPRPPSIPDPSLVIRDWDPIHQKATFACDTLLLPNTTLADPRFNGSTFTAWNVEQIFDAQGSTGWAWASASGAAVILDELKAATLYWTRASFLRVYRYRFVEADPPVAGVLPTRMALQAVTPSAGVPDVLAITPWSGVAGIVSKLAPSQEVLVVFENADPSLPRVIGYSLESDGKEPAGAASGLPLATAIDAQQEVDVGPTVPLVKLAGGSDFLVLAQPYAQLLSALASFASSLESATDPTVKGAATTLAGALSTLAPAATKKTTAT
jgi:hypothetical protein